MIPPRSCLRYSRSTITAKIGQATRRVLNFPWPVSSPVVMNPQRRKHHGPKIWQGRALSLGERAAALVDRPERLGSRHGALVDVVIPWLFRLFGRFHLEQ